MSIPRAFILLTTMPAGDERCGWWGLVSSAACLILLLSPATVSEATVQLHELQPPDIARRMDLQHLISASITADSSANCSCKY